jgi:type VI protein secretion system component VasF
VQSLEEAVKDLSDQMQASSEVIKALADQNTQLIQRVELNRVRLHRLAVLAAVAVVVLVAATTFLAVRG